MRPLKWTERPVKEVLKKRPPDGQKRPLFREYEVTPALERGAFLDFYFARGVRYADADLYTCPRARVTNSGYPLRATRPYECIRGRSGSCPHTFSRARSATRTPEPPELAPSLKCVTSKAGVSYQSENVVTISNLVGFPWILRTSSCASSSRSSRISALFQRFMRPF